MRKRRAPNIGLEPTPSSLRSSVAPASGRGSGPALNARIRLRSPVEDADKEKIVFNRMATLQKIKQKIIDRSYYISSHAEDEMLDDHLERIDVENAILKGKIDKKLTRDKRGTRYRIEGPATDGRAIHVNCRFKEDSNLIIVTVYALMEEL